MSVLLVLPLPAQQKQQKGKPIFPQAIAQARYVVVYTTDYGPGPSFSAGSPGMRTEDARLSTRMDPDDSRVAADMETAIRKWGKYSLATNTRDADLIFEVRKGRIVAERGSETIHVGTNREPSVTPRARVEAGDPLDALTIYDARLGIESAPLWRGRLAGGLDAPDVELLQQLRKEVEQAAKP